MLLHHSLFRWIAYEVRAPLVFSKECDLIQPRLSFAGEHHAACAVYTEGGIIRPPGGGPSHPGACCRPASTQLNCMRTADIWPELGATGHAEAARPRLTPRR